MVKATESDKGNREKEMNFKHIPSRKTQQSTIGNMQLR
jgi:hypothetical protein